MALLRDINKEECISFMSKRQKGCVNTLRSQALGKINRWSQRNQNTHTHTQISVSSTSQANHQKRTQPGQLLLTQASRCLPRYTHSIGRRLQQCPGGNAGSQGQSAYGVSLNTCSVLLIYFPWHAALPPDAGDGGQGAGTAEQARFGFSCSHALLHTRLSNGFRI